MNRNQEFYGNNPELCITFGCQGSQFTKNINLTFTLIILVWYYYKSNTFSDANI